ncbi:MAG: antibiotic biosynthesis monooxygenase [Candidatus Eiseniibacteriota bacterium]|nr:MAG: antibiotic biosynthesis monooxygenase [Candidatus Eisenbacteria bacterium]
MVRLTIELVVSEELCEQVARYFRALVGPTSAAPGCVRCTACRGLMEPRQFFLRVEWSTREDLEAYMRSNSFGSLLNLLDLAYKSPRVSFETVTEVKGLEYVAEVRSTATQDPNGARVRAEQTNGDIALRPPEEDFQIN